ncbi:hypothetical protein [Silanimonas sp.]|jgi:hypothetical protein|uniref:hypothetical protein n=1 Tax=Silanimonas sp. TaxID=1929290 RepID=UPI0022C26C16|nr:hypothetical protein [Silanimonas sp.]MCZ8116023.1 hypothetical protein [Silanimonas sp.]
MTARPVACLLFALSLSACSAEAGFPEPPVNPAPRVGWTQELVVESPVRPVLRVEMIAAYNIANAECLEREMFTGAPTSPSSKEVPLSVDALPDGRFLATVFEDLLLPSDLYGEGECRWVLAGVYSIVDDGVVRFQHSGAATTRSPERTQQVVSYTAFERSRFTSPAPSGGSSQAEDRPLFSVTSSLDRDQPIGPVMPDDDFTSQFPLERYVWLRSVGRPAD